GALVVDGRAAHHAGASDAQEIGYSLAVAAHYLRLLVQRGLEPSDAARLISFRYAVTDRHFEQIAKLRAARITWQRMCEASGVAGGDSVGEASGAAATQSGPARTVVHAVMSEPMMTRYSPHTN